MYNWFSCVSPINYARIAWYWCAYDAPATYHLDHHPAFLTPTMQISQQKWIHWLPKDGANTIIFTLDITKRRTVSTNGIPNKRQKTKTNVQGEKVAEGLCKRVTNLTHKRKLAYISVLCCWLFTWCCWCVVVWSRTCFRLDPFQVLDHAWPSSPWWRPDLRKDQTSKGPRSFVPWH